MCLLLIIATAHKMRNRRFSGAAALKFVQKETPVIHRFLVIIETLSLAGKCEDFNLFALQTDVSHSRGAKFRNKRAWGGTTGT